MTDISFQTRILLTLSILKGVGPAALGKIIREVPSFEKLPEEELRSLLPRGAATDIGAAEREADRQIALAGTDGVRIVSAADPDYPKLLLGTRNDPQILFVKGCLMSTTEKSVAIIGTREPTEHGKIITQRITEFFVGEEWSVVSGLAIGCDAIAHESALKVGGHTVAVLAHGLQTVAPSRHKDLAQRILNSGGALVTAFRFGESPLPGNFVKRDRVQAGLAQGVVMVQSDLAGGSLHASRASIEYGRWLAVPWPTRRDIERGEPKVRGNLELVNGSTQRKISLLKCRHEHLHQGLIVLKSRDDYMKLVSKRSVVVDSPPQPVQKEIEF